MLRSVLGSVPPDVPEAGRTPEVRADRCLNRRFAAVGCTDCRDVCPTGAIALVGQVPELDVDACVRCAACTVACASEALVEPRSPERLLRRTVEGIGAGERPDAVVLVCPRGGTVVPVEPPLRVVRHGRCLAALDVDDLLAVSGDGETTVHLDDVACAACPIGSLAPFVVASADEANALLGLFDRPPSVQLLSAHRAVLTVNDRDPIDGMQPRTSRRGWLRSLRNDLAQRATAAQVPPAPALHRAGGRVSDRLPKHLPQQHARLRARLRTWPLPSTVEVRGGEASADADPPVLPSIDERSCSGCGLCARFCPTDALTVHPEHVRSARPRPGPFELHLASSECIGCGVCVAACPEQAIRLDRPAVARDLVATASTPVCQGRLVRCASCGAPTLEGPPGSEVECFSCRFGPGPVAPNVDGAGLLADLARRAAGSDTGR